MKTAFGKILAIDFDGVLSSYKPLSVSDHTALLQMPRESVSRLVPLKSTASSSLYTFSHYCMLAGRHSSRSTGPSGKETVSAKVSARPVDKLSGIASR
jgi:hypothetical protein